jgi:hypothetical protein
MQKAIIVSTVAHVAIMTAGMVSFGGPKPYEVATVEAVPVDIFTDSLQSSVTRGSEKAQPIPDPITQPSAGQSETPKDTATEGKGLQNAPVPAERKTALATPKTAPPPPKPPAPEQAKPDPEPAPAPEPEPVEAQKPEPAPEPKSTDWASLNPPAPSAAPPQRPRPQPKSEAKAEPQKQDAPSSRQSFDADRIAALINRADQGGGGGANDQLPATLGRAEGQAQTLSMSELDALRRQIAACWNPPIGVAGAQGLVVRIRMSLEQSGHLALQPNILNASADPTFRAAADSAVRAIHRCAPYNLPAEKYSSWAEVVVNFDPREMLGY